MRFFRKKHRDKLSVVVRDQYIFDGLKAEESAEYFDHVMSEYAGVGVSIGEMDYLAWGAAHKFGTRVTAPGFASFRDGITIGENALAAAEFLDDEREKAFASCEEFGRKKRMQELMADVYARAKEQFDVAIRFM